MILLLQLLHQGLSLRSKAEYFYREDYPLIISHRGASGYIPEHSLPAYEMAIYMGTDFVEPDIIPSKEGTLFIHHDSYLSGTTNVADLPQYADKKVTKTITTVTGPETMTDWFSTDFTDEELKGLKLR